MQTPSASFSAQFQANLGQYPDSQLTRELVSQVAEATFDHYCRKVAAMPEQCSRDLSSKFRANLGHYKDSHLTRVLIYQLAEVTVDYYFETSLNARDDGTGTANSDGCSDDSDG